MFMRLANVLKKLIFFPRTEKSFANHLLNDTEVRKFRKPTCFFQDGDVISLPVVYT